MLVYRIQHPEDGLGPYTSAYFDEVFQRLLKSYHKDDEDNHPIPYMRSHQICGCRSLDSLQTWFNDGWLEVFRDAGFELKAFKVDGGRCDLVGQAVFDPAYATEVEAPTLDSLCS